MALIILLSGIGVGFGLFLILTVLDSYVNSLRKRNTVLTPFVNLSIYCAITTALLVFFIFQQSKADWSVLLWLAAFLLSGIIASGALAGIRHLSR